MRNIQIRKTKTGNDDAGLNALLTEARMDERKDRAFAASIRMESLAIHILNEGMTGAEAAELLRREAVRYENESQELH
jgi:hypothetical protein